MKYFVLNCLLLFNLTILNAQITEAKPISSKDTESKLSLSGRSYPIFLDGEEHSNFLLRYAISDKLKVDLEGFYDKYRHTDRFRTDVLFRTYLNNKVYILNGVQAELDLGKYRGEAQSPRIGVINGVGYEVNQQWMLEARSNIQINNSEIGSFGESFKTPAVFTLGSKVKF